MLKPSLWDRFCRFIFEYFEKKRWKLEIWVNKKQYPESNIHGTVLLKKVKLHGNIFIDEHSYMNSGQLDAGENSRIKIGKWCAIGYNVRIIAETHSIKFPTGPSRNKHKIAKEIIIGDNVWIGSNVFIREGINIGNNSIIGANSIVTKDIPPNVIVGGVPANIIKKV